MSILCRIDQAPPPGTHRLQFRGDLVHFVLTVDPPQPGSGGLRTNLGHAQTRRLEIVRREESDEPPLDRDWYDLPMRCTAPGRYELTVGLSEVGHFEAKCFFLPQGASEPLWPAGGNTALNIEPEETCCANIIYNAFVRQFGPYKKARSAAEFEDPAVKELDQAGYTVIPPSGTFRGLISELDFIIGRLGCRWIQLLPIHPTPTTYARMGRFGSPYAALSFTAVDPALAEFDPKATPLEQFLELVDAVHVRKGRLLLDMAINHTGWAAELHGSHPHWLVRNNEGQIENPGAWGIVWEDLTRLDYGNTDLWKYMAEVFLTWCRRGVDGFRCDAGYMIPVRAWTYIIAKVREQFPRTVFLLEGLGGKIEVTRRLLDEANFNWSYSELFQNYDRRQIESYLPTANAISAGDGLTVHFAETHDNNRLAAVSESYARMRTALSALVSAQGAFGFANGVEWLAVEKIDVHQAGGLNWGASRNQIDALARLNILLRSHPAFFHPVSLELVTQGSGNCVALLRRPSRRQDQVLVVANLEIDRETVVGWDRKAVQWPIQPLFDLLSGTTVPVEDADGNPVIRMTPGQVICLASQIPSELEFTPPEPGAVDHRLVQQKLRAKALELLSISRSTDDLNDGMLQRAAADLYNDPRGFCRRLDTASKEPKVIVWAFPADLNRRVMVPSGFFLLVRADHPFRVYLETGADHRVVCEDESLLDRRNRPFVLIAPPPEATHGLLTLQIVEYDPERVRRESTQLLCLVDPETVPVRFSFSRRQCLGGFLTGLDTDGRGAMMRASADWHHLHSRYDALLAANLDPHFPNNRQVLFTRCRAWIVYQGYSQAVGLDCLERFESVEGGGIRWRYRVPVGQGEHIVLQVTARLSRRVANCARIRLERFAASEAFQLQDQEAVTLILRPDIEDRDFHETTKAYTGPEHHWPRSVQPLASGFLFAPRETHHLEVRLDRGVYVHQPEWYYMVHRPLEAQRGLDAESDLFSPGYFSVPLLGRQQVGLIARARLGAPDRAQNGLHEIDLAAGSERTDASLESCLRTALDQFVVRRGDFRTVIAGFPWFLDWGRDTLIVVRGLVAAGRLQAVRTILQQFALFEDRGTLPNMIRGADASNRDTSDAPLWFFTACEDLVGRDPQVLDLDCNGRPLKGVLKDMALGLIQGCPNGVAMDAASGLIFSPAHFTWMDTNFPAGTPRQGYPVEIQALWQAALRFLSRIDPEGSARWSQLADRVRKSLAELFWLPESGYLSDCLHAEPGQSADRSQADDALRPNQLLAVTLGALTDATRTDSILRACQQLLVPGAIRSLADRPVRRPVEVRYNGVLLNDPQRPYQGRYEGDEDTRRKPAYHNGTAWTWLFPSFCEAWLQCYGPGARSTVRAWLSSSIELLNQGCIGQIPEILDGDAPHLQRGCDAQAWGVSELLRVWLMVGR